MSLGSEYLDETAYERYNPPYREKCYRCRNFDPKKFYCIKYLRGAETAVYRCPDCKNGKGENNERVY